MLHSALVRARAVLVAGAALTLFASLPARATETAATVERPAAATTAVAAAEPRVFKVPAGWRKQKRNGDVAYCRKIVTLGSRFEKLQCMNEAELEQYIAMNQENRDTMQQRIAVCGTSTVCSNP
jgi:hypothetical protein